MDDRERLEASDALSNVEWALDQMTSALNEGRYRFDEVHVRADLSYLRTEVRRAQEQHARSRVEAGTLGDDEVCNRCGGENVRWSAPSPLWNRVMRGNDINGDALHRDLVCPQCFIVLAAEVGLDGTWRVSMHPEPDGLIFETPSGRVWDDRQWLWVEPNAAGPGS